MKIPDSLKRYGLAKVFDYLDKDPMTNMSKVMDLVNKFAGDTLAPQRAMFDKVINDKDSCWHQLIEKVWTQTDPNVLKTVFNNFFVNANLVGWPKQEAARKILRDAAQDRDTVSLDQFATISAAFAA